MPTILLRRQAVFTVMETIHQFCRYGHKEIETLYPKLPYDSSFSCFIPQIVTLVPFFLLKPLRLESIVILC